MESLRFPPYGVESPRCRLCEVRGGSVRPGEVMIACWSPMSVSLEFPDFVSLQDGADLVGKAIGGDGFADEAVEACLTGAFHVGGGYVGGDGDDEGVLETRVGTQAVEDLVSVFLGEEDVHEDEVDVRERLGKLQDLPAGGFPFAFLDAEVGEQAGDEDEVLDVVLDDEYCGVFGFYAHLDSVPIFCF